MKQFYELCAAVIDKLTLSSLEISLNTQKFQNDVTYPWGSSGG